VKRNNGLQKTFSKFKTTNWIETKDFKYFQTKFELGQTKINLNKLFKYFSNLDVSKLIQIFKFKQRL
jgi:hypothetical protein